MRILSLIYCFSFLDDLFIELNLKKNDLREKK